MPPPTEHDLQAIRIGAAVYASGTTCSPFLTASRISFNRRSVSAKIGRPPPTAEWWSGHSCGDRTWLGRYGRVYGIQDASIVQGGTRGTDVGIDQVGRPLCRHSGGSCVSELAKRYPDHRVYSGYGHVLDLDLGSTS